VSAQADGDVVCDHFDDAADRVTRMLGGIHGCLEAGVILRIECAHRGLAQCSFVPGGGNQRGRGVLRPDGHDVGHETNAGDLLQEGLGEHAECDARGSLSGTRALKDGASLGQVVGQHAGQVRVTGTGPCQRSVPGDFAFVARSSIDEESGGGDRIRTHHRLPLGPFGITDTNRDRRSRGYPVTDTRENRDLVGLKLLPSATTVAEATTREATAQVLRRHMQPGGHSLDRCEQCGSVRFTGGHPSQHASQCPTSDKSCAKRLSRAERSRLRRLIPVRRGARFRTENIDDDAQRVVTGSQIRRDRDGES